MSEPLILTANLGGDAGARLDALRRRHFPDRGYTLPAHLTLFHHLPGSKQAPVLDALSTRAKTQSPMTLRATGLLDFGGGCAFAIDAPRLTTFRTDLATLWRDDLTAQDARGFRAHVTVQNKVNRATAKETLDRLRAGFAPFDIPCPGLQLWRYRGGPWDHVADIPFGGIE